MKRLIEVALVVCLSGCGSEPKARPEAELTRVKEVTRVVKITSPVDAWRGGLSAEGTNGQTFWVRCNGSRSYTWPQVGEHWSVKVEWNDYSEKITLELGEFLYKDNPLDAVDEFEIPVDQPPREP